MGYTHASANKLNGIWTANGFDPLNEAGVIFENLGTSMDAAIIALRSYPAIPKHYVCGHHFTCTKCGVIDKPTGYSEPVSGNFMHRCRSCANTWVAVTLSEQEEQAEAWMEEALEVLDPLFKLYVKRG